MRCYYDKAFNARIVSRRVSGIWPCSMWGDKAKEEPSTSTNEPAGDTVAAGESIAKSKCIGCHGGDLTGGMGPNLHGLALSKEEIVDILKMVKAQCLLIQRKATKKL